MDGIEAILLTGGASSRMGADKSKLEIDGEQLGARIARLLRESGVDVTVCGREPIAGYAFLEDERDFAGPLVAISRFQPVEEFVFVASCDLIGFDPGIISKLSAAIDRRQAAVPQADDSLQPLCGLYRSDAFAIARALVADGESRMMRWVDRLDYIAVLDLDPSWLRNVNSPADLPRA